MQKIKKKMKKNEKKKKSAKATLKHFNNKILTNINIMSEYFSLSILMGDKY